MTQTHRISLERQEDLGGRHGFATCLCGWKGEKYYVNGSGPDPVKHVLEQARSDGAKHMASVAPIAPPDSRRDYFAAHAPTEVPKWFEFKFNEPRPVAPKSPGGSYGITPQALPEWNVYERAKNKYQFDEKAWKLRWEMERLTAWRYAYADAMIQQSTKE